MRLKEYIEKDIIEQAQFEVERKNMIKDADDILKDLQNWKKNR